MPPRSLGGFDIVRLLGEGGMGKVYLAVQRSIRRQVAVKVLAPEFARDPEFVTRFVREARAAGALAHANVVSVYDAGTDAATGAHYIAFELVEGGDLEGLVRREAPVPERRCLRIARTIAVALGHANEHGLVHRDLKPANVLIAADGTLKLADLGLAKQTTAASSITQTGVIVGTPHYMSPEQADGVRDIDIRTDLYALGLILYRMAAARHAFEAETPIGLLTKRLTSDCPDPRERAPSLSGGFAELIASLTARDRADRPATPADVVAEIDRLLTAPPERSRAPLGPLVAAGAVLLVAIVGLVAYAVSPDAAPTEGAVAGGTGVVDPSASGEPAVVEPPIDRPPPVEPAADGEIAEGWPIKLPVALAELRDRTKPNGVTYRLVNAWGAHDWRHDLVVNRVAFSPDGREVLTVSNDGTAVVRDLATGVSPKRLRASGKGEATQIHAGAYLPGGGIAFGTHGGRVALLDAARREARDLVPASGAGSRVLDLVVTPDDRHLIMAVEDRVRAYALDSRRLVWEVEHPSEAGEPAAVSDVDVSPDGTQMISASTDGTLRLWDLGGGDAPPHAPIVVRTERVGPQRWQLFATFTPDGARILCDGSTQAVWVLDADSGAKTGELVMPVPGIRDVAVAPDGWRAAVGCDDGRVRIVVVETGEALGSCGPFVGAISSVAFSPDGRHLVAGSVDGSVRLFEASGAYREVRPPTGHAGSVLAVGISGDGRWLASLGGEARVRFHDLAGADPPGPVAYGSSPARSIAVTPDGSQAFTVGPDRELVRWPRGGGLRRMPVPSTDPGSVRLVVASPSEPLLAVGTTRHLSLLDASSGVSRALVGLSASPVAIDFSPAGDTVFVLAANGVRFEVSVADPRSIRQSVTGFIRGRGDDPLVAGALTEGWTFGRTERELLLEATTPGASVESLSVAALGGFHVSPDGKRVVLIRGAGKLAVLELHAGGLRVLDQPSLGDDDATSLAFGPDSRSFTVGTRRGRILQLAPR